MRPPQRGTAKLADKITLNEKYTQYFFELTSPPIMEFDAGQYVSIQVSPRGDRRSYSICNNPTKTHAFELLVDLSPQGMGTTYLANLALGEEISILGPMGVFTLVDNDETALNFVATGSGVAPFRSMILDLLINKKDKRDMTLYWGLRHENTLFWQDEFLDLAEAHDNFHFHPVISKPSSEWPLCQGHVTNCVSVHPQIDGAGYYLCGNAKMIEEMKGILADKSVPAVHVHHEKFF